MLLTISTNWQPAGDLGYLLHKHPGKCQDFELSFGRAHVFYPEVGPERCMAALLLDVDPVGMVRGGRNQDGLLDQYVNDRPYVCSSFMSVAIAQVFGTALKGQCKDRPELARTPIPLTARLAVLPCRGGAEMLERIFGPLGYEVKAQRHVLDEKFPEWGEGPYFTVELSRVCTLAELLTHLYVLIPVFDNFKHYYVGQDEVEKLLAKGAGWLAGHPEREFIARRYLKHQPSLARQALQRLIEENGDLEEDQPADEENLERRISLNEERLGAVLAALRACRARRVLDLGCGEGHLIRELIKDRQFEQILGLDVSIRSLEIAADKLRLDRLPQHQQERVKIVHGSLMYRDRRLEGFDAEAVVEVIEHLDPPRLAAFERVLFEHARPRTVVLTTPNREYNVKWEDLADPEDNGSRKRHGDHRFEWNRTEFQAWANQTATRFGYTVRYLPIGPEDPILGPPTQMGIFTNEKHSNE